MSDLGRLYSELDFCNGDLYSATETPDKIPRDVWLEKGEWLSAAKRAGADKLFFIDNNPIVVFAECGIGFEEKLKTFNRVWSLARPRLLFLVSPGEINVYDLAQKPINLTDKKEKRDEFKSLATLRDLTMVAEKLQNFHRDNIESGKIFEDGRFGDINNRADKSLIRDLKFVRHELILAGLSKEKIKYAHALIGRSIFIRYLEDRQILTEDYFRKVAKQKAGWTDILKDEPKLDISQKRPFYPRILKNKEFTYALFKTLARDFNGDMFPDDANEQKMVKPQHLDLINGFLYGDIGVQRNLFLKSYCFEIVPLDLISSIYEEFYHPSIVDEAKKQKIREDGVYYTPPVLAEFVLSKVLTADELKKKPRVFDPACGSGIFLVEAFRRIVRHNRYEKKKTLTFDELKSILHNQIAGIEINEEAARITAFSLYLSMLNYLEPPSIYEQIRLGNKLPSLIATENLPANADHCILVCNTFDNISIENNRTWKQRFGSQSADIVVGNPPWGAPGNAADISTKIREKTMLKWCEYNGKPISDKEPSQAFLWRSLDFLREGGKAGMLVSAGILFKHSSPAQKFREKWMDNICLREVVNFIHVRKFFFKDATSPFIAVFYEKGKQKGQDVIYWSVKQVIALRETQAVILSRYDANILRNENLTSSKPWKSYWFGRSSDNEFIKKIQHYPALIEFVDNNNSGRGYQTYAARHDSSELGVSKTIKKITSRYDVMEFTSPPPKIYNIGPKNSYKGKRLIINEGILEGGKIKGYIVARFEDKPFSFSRSVYGIKLKSDDLSLYKLLLGILWSSFARYYYFSTSANWGLWHHKLLLDEIFQLPIPRKVSEIIEKRIISTVDMLRNFHPQGRDILNIDGVSVTEIAARRQGWQMDLDEAVYELYGLSEEHKDLIRDCCEVTLPFFYNPLGNNRVMRAVDGNDISGIEMYVDIFCRRWNAYLQGNEEMHTEVHVGGHGNLLAIEFFPADRVDSWIAKVKNDSWEYVLDQISKSLLSTMGTSEILLEGVVHVISDNGIIVIKRNERRFWTRSLAREDADTTLCKAMQKNRGE